MNPTIENVIAIAPMRRAWVKSSWECLGSVIEERRFLAMLTPPTLEESQEYMLGLIENDFPIYVAWLPNADRIVGWCDVHPRPREAFGHCGVLGVGVHRDFRGDRIGDLLMKSTLNHCRRIRLERVELDVYRSNFRAMALYLKHGFIVEGVKIRARKVDGQYDDVIEMVRHIR